MGRDEMKTSLQEINSLAERCADAFVTCKKHAVVDFFNWGHHVNTVIVTPANWKDQPLYYQEWKFKPVKFKTNIRLNRMEREIPGASAYRLVMSCMLHGEWGFKASYY